MEYIILNGKKPTHEFKNGVGTKTWDEVKDFDDIGVVVPEGYVVLDFDSPSDAKIMLHIVDELDLKTKVMQTTRGIHCWFKASEEKPKNYIKSRLAIGIYCDRKSGGRNAYVKIKQDGLPRPWIRDKYKDEELEPMPDFLSCVAVNNNRYNFKEMTEGSGRNNELFTYISYLQDRGYSKEQIINIINSTFPAGISE